MRMYRLVSMLTGRPVTRGSDHVQQKAGAQDLALGDGVAHEAHEAIGPASAGGRPRHGQVDQRRTGVKALQQGPQPELA